MGEAGLKEKVCSQRRVHQMGSGREVDEKWTIWNEGGGPLERGSFRAAEGHDGWCAGEGLPGPGESNI